VIGTGSVGIETEQATAVLDTVEASQETRGRELKEALPSDYVGILEFLTTLVVKALSGVGGIGRSLCDVESGTDGSVS